MIDLKRLIFIVSITFSTIGRVGALELSLPDSYFESEYVGEKRNPMKMRRFAFESGITNNYCNGHESIFQEPAVKRAVDMMVATSIAHIDDGADPDKKLHSIYGAALGAGGTTICSMIMPGKDNNVLCFLAGAGVSALAGIAKEIKDSDGSGNVEAMDAIYTLVPGSIISIKIAFD